VPIIPKPTDGESLFGCKTAIIFLPARGRDAALSWKRRLNEVDKTAATEAKRMTISELRLKRPESGAS
jgi:hypothetical protein